ncbi:MAG: Spy/CpxP family protein refolding chaperone [Nitrospiraceae bacterium]
MKFYNLRGGSLLFLAILMATAWTLVFSTTSWADGRGHGHGKRSDAASFIWHVLKAKDAVGLTDEQETRLRTIAIAFKKDRVKKTAEVDLARIDVHQLLHKQTSGDEIDAAVRKMYALKADLRIASIKAFQEARTVLTPEQQKKMKELHEKERASMEGKQAERHHGYGEHDRG